MIQMMYWSPTQRLTSLALNWILFLSCLICCQTACNRSTVHSIDNGHYTEPDTIQFQVDDEIIAVCDPGYALLGCQILRCTEEGTFVTAIHVADNPICTEVNECSQPTEYSYSDSASVSTSDVENECTAFQSQYTPARCHENARCINTPGSYKCLCNGDYVGDGIDTCEYDPPECELLTAPENGFIKKNTSRTTHFNCHTGYKLFNSRERSCTRTGWNGVQPGCELTGCGDPGTPENGFKVGNSYEPGNSVTYVCHKDYTLKGSSRRVCTHQKRWNGWKPFCEPPKSVANIAGDIRRDFIDKFELYTDSSKGTSAMGRLSRGNSVGLDLVFAFDKSSSVGTINFQRGLNFTKMLIEEFGVDHTSYGGTKVAAVSFASDAKIEFNYDDDVDTKDKVFRKLDAMEGTLGGGTAMKEALEIVRLVILADMRNNSKKALFIVTDGHANTESPVAIARDLRENVNFEIFAVGVGNAVDREQIRMVASVPYTSHVFLIDSFDDLAVVTDIIAEKRTDYTRCGIAGDWELPEKSNTAKPNAWPWVAHVYREEFSFYCEGALICEQWVVVAASCLDGNPLIDESSVVIKEKLRIKLGKYQIFVDEGCEQNATVVEIHRPDTYTNESLDSDIALLKLDHPLQLVNCIRTICLPTRGDSFNFNPGNDENRCVLAGWGSKSLWDKQEEIGVHIPSPTPKQVALPLVANANCERIAGVELNDNMLCAGNRYKLSEHHECTGQVGSPLVCRRDDDTWTMMGVTSDGSGCSVNEQYSYFTKVFNYVDWINDVTESCNEAHVTDIVGGF